MAGATLRAFKVGQRPLEPVVIERASLQTMKDFERMLWSVGHWDSEYVWKRLSDLQSWTCWSQQQLRQFGLTASVRF